MGVHNKTLSINGHSDQNISQLVKKPWTEMLFILHKYLVHLLNCKAALFVYIDLRHMQIQWPFFQSSGIFVKCVFQIVTQLLLWIKNG